MRIECKRKLPLLMSLAFLSFGQNISAAPIEEIIVISSKQAAGISTQELAGSVVTFNEAALKQSFTVDLVDIGKNTHFGIICPSRTIDAHSSNEEIGVTRISTHIVELGVCHHFANIDQIDGEGLL